jgi:hypothetical protein
MKFAVEKIQSLKFRKIFMVLFAALLIYAVVSVAYLAINGHSQRVAVINFERISEDVARGDKAVQEVKGQLDSIAARYPGIVDLLILDETGQITYSSHNSRYAEGGVFKPDSVISEPGSKILNAKRWFGGRWERFGRPNSGSFARSITDNVTGEQIILISTPNRFWLGMGRFWNRATSIQYGLIYILGFFFRIVFRLLLTLWVYADSKKYEKNTVLWTTLTLISGLTGWVIYLIMRERNQEKVLQGV